MRDEDNYRIELFIFPDGTEVEMVVFDREAAPSRQKTRTETAGAQAFSDELRHTTAPLPVPQPPCGQTDDPHACPLCGCDLVYPVDWARSGDTTWNVTLRCPNCETRRVVVLSREGVEAFNRDLYHGTQALAREAETTTRRNFEDEIAKIIAALSDDLILPMDF